MRTTASVILIALKLSLMLRGSQFRYVKAVEAASWAQRQGGALFLGCFSLVILLLVLLGYHLEDGILTTLLCEWMTILVHGLVAVLRRIALPLSLLLAQVRTYLLSRGLHRVRLREELPRIMGMLHKIGVVSSCRFLVHFRWCRGWSLEEEGGNGGRGEGGGYSCPASILAWASRGG